MARTLLTDSLWKRIDPHLPDPKPSPKGGRPRVGNRSTVAGILFVLRHGIPWRDLPLELGYGSGITCWRRLVAWQEAGVWDAVWQALLAALNRDDRLVLERAALDASVIPAQKGGDSRAPIPSTAGKPAANTTSSLTNKASRSRPWFRRRTRTIRNASSRRSTPSSR